MQSTKYWSLLWVKKVHPCHEAAIPGVQMMDHLLPTSPEAADTTFSVWLLQLILSAGLLHSCKLLLLAFPFHVSLQKVVLDSQLKEWPPATLDFTAGQLSPERLSPAQPVSSDITKLGFPASSPSHSLMHWAISYFDMNLNPEKCVLVCNSCLICHQKNYSF